MQLLKRRTFNDYFSDSFGFIKENGGHFFKNYFIIASVPMALVILFYYFYLQSVFNLEGLGRGYASSFENYFTSNPLVFVLAIIIFIFVFTVFALVQYAYTPIYMNLYLKKGTDFTFKEIMGSIFKENLGKLLGFFFFSILLAIPVYFAVGVISLILIITIVGWIIPIIVMMLWYNMALFAFIDGEKGLWDSFNYAWKLIFRNFWKNVGAVTIFTVIIAFISFGFSMLMNIISGAATFTVGINGGSTVLVIIMLITTAITQIVSIFLQMLIQIMNGIVYYSSVEELENKSGMTEIDKIGLGE
ncbi:MAG: hypothetical protein PHE56_06525 [Bacteroidales bacterium]|jgi:hypothetical protein|nr:hypothetical protein [Bacteroidales bacterium]